MKFMVTLITDGTSMEGMTAEEITEFGQKMGEFMGEGRKDDGLQPRARILGERRAGVLLHTDALSPPADARTLRRKSGRLVVTDGPFAETKEQIAGYMVLECADLDEAMGWAERMPVSAGALEVRPLAGRSQ